jgi:integrase
MTHTPRRFPFTEAKIAALPSPEAGRAIYRDERTPGLALRVFATGRRVYYAERKVEGRPERVTLGTWPTLTVEGARKATQDLAGRIARGENPAALRREQRQERTFGATFDLYLEKWVRARGKPERNPASYFRRWLSRWADRKLSTITRQEARALHEEIANATSGANANRVMVAAHAVFNWARRQELFDGEPPTSTIDRYPERARDRFLQPDELPKFFAALKEEPEDTRDFFLLALLTGARRANVLAMRWDEINRSAATWRIPVTKSGDSHIIPLVPEAMQILDHRANAAGDSLWVFPSASKSGHLEDPKRAWQRIRERTGLLDLRIHDLRRTLGSWQAATGASLPIIGKTLAHRNVSTTAIYARLNTDPVREAMGKATTAMLEAGGTTRKGKRRG